jgi:hypothetical protein
MSVDRHVPLDRRFTELGDEKQMEDAAVRSLLARMNGRPSGISWEDIYADGRSCVILGEDSTRTWRTEDGTPLDWSLLLHRLSDEAKLILGRRPDIERLEVLGVDVAPALLKKTAV